MCLFHGIEVGAQMVLFKLLLEPLEIPEWRVKACQHPGEPGGPGGSPAVLAGDNLVAAAISRRWFNVNQWLYGAKFPKATAKITEDADVLLAFFDYPAQHWIRLRSTNPIESTFSTVRHRTKVTKRPGSRAAGQHIGTETRD